MNSLTFCRSGIYALPVSGNFGNLLESLLRDLGIADADLARELGTSEKTIWNWKQRDELPRGTSAVQLSDYLEIPWATFRQAASGKIELDAKYRDRNRWRRERMRVHTNEPAREQQATIPVLGKVAASGWVESFTEPDPEYLPISMTGYPDAFALRVDGDSMAPDYRAGDFIICQNLELPAKLERGDDVVIQCNGLGDGRATFKRVDRVGEDAIYLRPLNPKYEKLKMRSDAIERVSKVIGTFRAKGV